MFLERNTVFLRDTHRVWKTLICLLPEEEFHPVQIFPVRAAKSAALLIQRSRRGIRMGRTISVAGTSSRFPKPVALVEFGDSLIE